MSKNVYLDQLDSEDKADGKPELRASPNVIAQPIQGISNPRTMNNSRERIRKSVSKVKQFIESS